MFFSHLFHRHAKRDTYLRNFIFGVEDSLVSTVGLLAGVAAAEISAQAILTTGLVLIVVEGFSMGIGSFLTEETTEEKVSLSDRFGLWLSFYPFDQDQYLRIAAHWAGVLAGRSISEDEIRQPALLWALERGARSGRIAWHFARNWAAEHAGKRK